MIVCGYVPTMLARKPGNAAGRPNCAAVPGSGGTMPAPMVQVRFRSPSNRYQAGVQPSAIDGDLTPSRSNVMWTRQHAPRKFEPCGQKPAGCVSSVYGMMLSIWAFRLNAGSRRSTTGENVADKPFVGGCGPLKIPVPELTVGSAIVGSAAPVLLVTLDVKLA